MANNNNRNVNDKDVIYDSEKDRHVTHQADGTTKRDGDRVRETRETQVHREEPKKKSPWPWLIPLLLLLLAIPLLMSMCNNDKDDKKEDNKTEETTTEETTTESASAVTFNLASIVNFDLAA